MGFACPLMGAPLLHSASPPVAMPMPKLFRGASLGHHHLHKLLVVDLPIPIDVSLTDHLINLFIRKLLPKVCHHMPQLRSTDEAITVAVKDLEGDGQINYEEFVKMMMAK